MIRHVVMWKLGSSDPTERKEHAAGIRQRLESLVGIVPGLESLRVLADVGSTPGNWDVLLISDHADEAAVDEYQTHPEHLAAAAWVKTVVQSRACVDGVV